MIYKVISYITLILMILLSVLVTISSIGKGILVVIFTATFMSITTFVFGGICFLLLNELDEMATKGKEKEQ